jgi:hypothetical protein
MIDIKVKILIIIIFTSFLIGALCSFYIINYIKKLILKKRFEKAKIGEFEAKNFLKNLGFTIIAEQPQLTSSIFVDKIKYNYNVKVDYIVQKKNKKSIVEAKSGEEAINPLNINTRRQLLEYMILYNVDKVYLFDAKNKRLKEIRFVFQKKSNYTFLIFLCIILGIFIGILLFLIFIKLFQ